MTDLPALILASSSRYRRQLLERLNLPFTAIAPEVDESATADETGGELAMRLAELKASTVAAAHPSALVIGSDQVAECGQRLLGKPGSSARALAQLESMQGRIVVFHTAVAVALGSRVFGELVPTAVRMRNLNRDTLRRYVDADDPIDCAGAFKSESMGVVLAEYMRSDDPTALVGLPLIATLRLLGKFGLELP
ncbi:MAG: septum formation protein Maf [Wenzhouxiangella sp.]|nr:MAG: septum formation protein Maf [Wenzhouxiangella sp.]